MKKINPLLTQLDASFKEVQSFLDREHKVLPEEAYDARYRPIESKLWTAVTNSFFFFVTGEPNFDAFYSRFGTGYDDKPSAWDGGFIPDKIAELMWIGVHVDLKDRVEQVKAFYEQCRQIEKRHLKNRSRDPIMRPKRVKK